MKTAFIIFLVIVALSIAFFFILGKYSQKSAAPGLVNGRLSKCPDKPNCVSSEFSDDAEHYIEAITNRPGDNDESTKTISTIVATIQKMNGVVHIEKDDYVAATFTSSIFGFVDDFEIRIDPVQGLLHVRSASRVGHSDMGVNRKRVEQFKQLYGT